MHALAEPPVSPTVVGAEGRDRDVVALDQRRVVVRLRDGETILVGGSPSYEDALVLAQKTILKLAEVGEGEWPMLGDRFINPDAIVSVDGLRGLSPREPGPGRAEPRPAPRTAAGAAHRRTVGDDPEQVDPRAPRTLFRKL